MRFFFNNFLKKLKRKIFFFKRKKVVKYFGRKGKVCFIGKSIDHRLRYNL